MFRKVLAATTAALLVSLTLSVAPASAAVKNGTPCSKAGATTKSGGSTFKCIKYALVKNSKLTWRTNDCITTVNAYLKTNKSVATAKAETAKTITALDLAIASLEESITALQNIEQVWDHLFPAEQARIIQVLIERITIRKDGISIKWHAKGMPKLLRESITQTQYREAA